MLRLSHYLAVEEFEDGKPSSTLLVYFCGVLGISADGSTFDRPRNYTAKLSAVIYCMRLTLFESVLPRFAYSGLGWEARPRCGQLGRLQPLRREKMCLGSQAPLGELISLRGYGRAVSRSDGPSFLFHWSDDGQTVSWDGLRLSMAQFRQISHSALESATRSCDRLMYDWHPPPYRLDEVRDVLSKSTEGYSFVSDTKNGLSDAYLGLSERACLAAADGLMTDRCWDAHAVKRYLALHDDMLQQIALLVHLTAGQASRGSELLCIEHRNGPSTLRGVCVHAGKIMIVCRHNKSRRATNNEFQVARYLPAGVGSIVYRYLVFIRPFVAMLCRECRGWDVDTSLLFASHARPSELWKTGHLSKALQQQTMSVAGISMGVQVYRQLSIAITAKHIKQICETFNRYDDESKDADVGVAFAWQSGHRPLARATVYGLDGAFPDSLQPELLRIYEWVSYEWHRFLQLHGRLLQPRNGTEGLESEVREQEEPVAVRKRKERSMTLPKAPSPKRCAVSSNSSEGDSSDVDCGEGNHAAQSDWNSLWWATEEEEEATQEEEERRRIQSSEAESDGQQADDDWDNDGEIRRWEEGEVRRRKEEVDCRRATTEQLQAAADAIIDRLLYYDDRYQVLICREHRYAIRSLDTHLRSQHAVAAKFRRIIVDRHAPLPMAKPRDVRQPRPFGPPFDVLGPPADALLCKSCGFTSVQPTWIRRHCNTVHNWRSTAREKAHWTSIKAQTFFTAGGLQRWFAVLVPDKPKSASEKAEEELMNKWKTEKLMLGFTLRWAAVGGGGEQRHGGNSKVDNVSSR
jgi:Orsellinic acid/F9775 biosynthesis cluster protein D